MKKFIAFITVIIAAAASLTAQAQTFPAEIPLSRERQEFVARGLINQVTVGVQGNTVSGTWILSKPYTGPKGDLAAISALARTMSLDYSVDPTEKVSSFGNYDFRTADGSRVFNLFYGQKDWNYVKDASGKWSAPADKLMIDNMALNQCPIEILGLSDAYIVLRDGTGNQIGRYSLSDMVQGNFLVLTGSVDLSIYGEMYIRLNSGAVGVYSLDGKLKTVVQQSHTIGTSIPSIRQVADNSAAITYLATDSMVIAKYTVATTVNVVFNGIVPSNIARVVLSEKKALEANPTGGTVVSVDPSKTPTITFQPKAGEEWVVIFEKKSGKG